MPDTTTTRTRKVSVRLPLDLFDEIERLMAHWGLDRTTAITCLLEDAVAAAKDPAP